MQVGEQVAAALTNLGIDVDVDVKEPGTGNTTRVGKTTSTTTAEDGTTTKTTETTTETTATTDQPKKAEEEAKEGTMGTETPRGTPTDWTLVSGEEDDGVTVTRVLSAADASAPPANMYPSVAPAAPAATLHHQGYLPPSLTRPLLHFETMAPLQTRRSTTPWSTCWRWGSRTRAAGSPSSSSSSAATSPPPSTPSPPTRPTSTTPPRTTPKP